MRGIVFGIVIVIGIIFFAYKAYAPVSPEPVVPVTPVQDTAVLSTEPPVFAWKFEYDVTKNLDGLPQTNVILVATYDTEKVSKRVATVPGGCNDLQEKEKDSVPNSTVAQCYAAGAGDRFKVVKGPDSYLVMKKVFEEGSPEYNPPVQPYEMVAEFPLAV